MCVIYVAASISNLAYKGTVLSYKQNAINQLLAATRSQSPQPVSTNETATLEDSFGELLFNVISEKFKAHLRTGVPELGIPSLDPLKFSEKLNLQPSIGGDPYDIELRNLRISGISNFYLKDLTPKLTQLRFRISLLFPKIIADADYVVNGSIYEVFDVKGAGVASLEYTDVVLRTTVNLELKNGTLRITTADPPMVDFANTKINLKAGDARTNQVDSAVTHNNMASELGPLLFWMLADHVVDECDYYAATYVNDAIKSFAVPDSFKPMVTWLIRRRTQTLSGFSNPLSTGMPMRRFSPMSVLGEMVPSLVQVLSQVRPPNGFALPSALENLRSTFRSSPLRKLLKKK